MVEITDSTAHAMGMAPKTDPLNMFRKNIQEKIASDFSNLIPNEVIEKLILDSVNTMLYEDVTPPGQRSSYHHAPKAFIKDAVEKQSKEFIEKAIRTAMNDKEKEIHEAVAAYINENAGNIIATLIMNMLKGNAYNLGQQLSMMLQQR